MLGNVFFFFFFDVLLMLRLKCSTSGTHHSVVAALVSGEAAQLDFT